MVSICITVKNRSKVKVDDIQLLLFPNCIKSIVEAVSPDIPCEIIVTDFQSDDWPLEEWIEKAASPIPVKLIKVEGGFSRGKGLNTAAIAATGSYLLFTDADSLLSKTLFDSGIKYLNEGKAFFPVLFSFLGPEHQDGWWRHEGFGNCMIKKNMFHSTGGWPEYISWGKEDDDFHATIASDFPVVREEVPGFYHQWHPDDKIWKNRYAEHAAEIAHEIEQVKLATQELIEIIPSGESLILVDESRFGTDSIPGRNTIPFTEVNGEYGGAPVDSNAAIREFERLNRNGVSHMAFAWMAFWWLEHYTLFWEYLKERFACVLKNDRLIVFDLQKKLKNK